MGSILSAIDAGGSKAHGKINIAFDEMRMARRLDDHPQLAVREVNLMRELGHGIEIENALVFATLQWPNSNAICSVYVDWLRESGRLNDAHMRARRNKIAPGVARELVIQLRQTKQHDDALQYLDLLQSLPADIGMFSSFPH